MSTVTVSGYDCLAAVVQIPAWGIWWAGVELDEAAELSGAVTIDCAGLELVGTIMSGGPWQGRSRYRVAGGAGGWGRTVARRGYRNDAGVRRLTVIQDAAGEVGETVDSSTVSGTVGGAWTRPEGPASDALRLLAPQAWHVGEDGVTRLGLRAESSVDSEITVTGRDDAAQWLELACDDLSGLVPGVVVDGIAAVDAEHRLVDGTLRTRLWGSGEGYGDRLSGALSRLVGAVAGLYRLRGVWSYRVVSQTGQRLTLQAVRASTGLPDLHLVRQRYAPGYSVEHQPGSLVLVAFVDGDAAQPVVVAGDDPESPGYVPPTVTIDADSVEIGAGLGRVLREGDTMTLSGVQAGVSAAGVTALVTIGLGAPPVASKVLA